MMVENSRDGLRERTLDFGLRFIRMYAALPKSAEARVLGMQALKCGTSVGAQYREAFRARSRAEFASKMQSALQELEEAAYWLELMDKSGIVKSARLASLRGETDELTAIFVASVKTARKVREA
jgi:four helix bundle protein